MRAGILAGPAARGVEDSDGSSSSSSPVERSRAGGRERGEEVSMRTVLAVEELVEASFEWEGEASSTGGSESDMAL